MLFLPIGRDESEIRRHAWVSYSIIALNVAIYLAMAFASRHFDYSALNEKWSETSQFLATHPYVTVPPQLERFLSARDRTRIAQALQTTPQPDPAERVAAQQKMDRLGAEVDALIHETPGLRFSYVPADPGFLTLVTSMFVHGGFMHLLGNMLFFFVTGPFLEDVFGRPLFALLYFVGGFVGTWTYALTQAHSYTPLIGASGAVAAIMGAYLVRFWRSKVEFFFMPFLWRPTLNFRFFLPALVVLPFWFCQQLYFAVTGEQGSGVAFWSHVGGFAFGALFAAVVQASGWEKKFVDPLVEKQISWHQSDRLIRAADAQGRGDLDLARRELGLLLRDKPDDVDALRAAWDVALAGERWSEAAVHGSRLLDLYLRSREIELAGQLAAEASRQGVERLGEKLMLKAGSVLERAGEAHDAAMVYGEVAYRSAAPEVRMRALLKQARLLVATNATGEARDALDRLAAMPQCTGEWASAREAELARIAEAERLL